MDHEEYKALLERAKASTKADTSEAAAKNVEEKLERLAGALLLEWLVGDRRFESQSQQTEYWLARFYEELFTDEQPDTTRIYERFGLALPRAAYIARLLRARRVAQWRQNARAEVKAQLERHRAAAEEAQAEGQAHITEFDLSLSPGAADELRVIYDRLAAFAAEHERPRPPRAKPSFGNTRWLAVPADTLLQILDAVAAEGKA